MLLMKQEEPEKTSWGSIFSKTLSKGCQQCIAGEKMVVLATSKCSSSCYYCPLSIERKEAVTAFANERPFLEAEELFSEADNMEAKGASMTGGDPLELHSFNDTVKYCKLLKKRYGRDFHIHAYTRGKDLNAEMLTQIALYLDEIRFHVTNPKKDLITLGMALETNLDVGIEIPVIPTKSFTYYINLIHEFEKLVENSAQFHFVNLNELEISETNYRNLLKYDLVPDPINLSAIKGSADLAAKIVEWSFENSKIPVHFCALSTKDNIQLPNRLFRIAKNTMLPSDVLIEEGSDKGLLIRGIISGEHQNLDEIRKFLVYDLEIPPHLVSIDKVKNRILTNAAILEELKDEIVSQFPRAKLGIAEEYPSHDNLQTTYIPIKS
jgi:pyruvate formate-lyase activating enzyme-like uncharacterized protein